MAIFLIIVAIGAAFMVLQGITAWHNRDVIKAVSLTATAFALMMVSTMSLTVTGVLAQLQQQGVVIQQPGQQQFSDDRNVFKNN